MGFLDRASLHGAFASRWRGLLLQRIPQHRFLTCSVSSMLEARRILAPRASKQAVAPSKSTFDRLVGVKQPVLDDAVNEGCSHSLQD